MVLIRCPECGKEISNGAKKCIHCGFPLSSMGENPGHNKSLGIVAISEDKNIAKKSGEMGADEMMLLEASQVLVEGNNAFKLDWYITMTNQRFILSKLNHWKKTFLEGMFGMIAGSALKRGIPAYEIPFKHISSVRMADRTRLLICTKDGKEHTYTMLVKKDAAKMEDRINHLFRG